MSTPRRRRRSGERGTDPQGHSSPSRSPNWIDRFGGLRLVLPVAAVLVAVVTLIWLNRPAGQPEGIAFTPLSHPDAVGRIEGNSDAPVRVVMYADYQCPHCGAFFRETEPALRKEFVDTGIATIQFVNFPILGAESVRAAEASACADVQGFFWQYHDVLFQNQPADGRENVGAYSVDRLKAYARTVESAVPSTATFDAAEFDACVDSRATSEEVQDQLADGKANKVTSTPSFLVNGTLIAGAQSLDTFRDAIRRAGGG